MATLNRQTDLANWEPGPPGSGVDANAMVSTTATDSVPSDKDENSLKEYVPSKPPTNDLGGA